MVDRLLSDEAVEFGRVVRSAVQDAGGFELVMRSESDPGLRTRVIEPILTSVGVFDLEPSESGVQLEAAASVCRTAGSFALPYPIAERLSCPTNSGASALAMTLD